MLSVSEADEDAGTGGDVAAGSGRLVVGSAATHDFELESSVLGRFDGAANGLSHERWHLDSALLDIQDDSSAWLLRVGASGRFDVRLSWQWGSHRRERGFLLAQAGGNECVFSRCRRRFGGNRRCGSSAITLT